MNLQRDIIINEIKKKLKKDKNIIFCSADFGAASLDELRNKNSNQFIHCGISEQAMFDIASGFALDNRKVFVYAMAPFISLRALEQIKCGPGIMNLPICIISVGIGLGYANAGPTHYACEDLVSLRAIPNLNIYTFSDNVSAKKIIDQILKKQSFSYLRLDRSFLPDLSHTLKFTGTKFRTSSDFKNFKNKTVLISHGYMVHECIKLMKSNRKKFEVIDLICSSPISNKLKDYLQNANEIVCVDEQIENSDISIAVSKYLQKKKFLKK